MKRLLTGQVGAVWLLSHAMLLLLGNTSLFRPSWLSLAEMEVPTPLNRSLYLTGIR